MTRLQSGDKGGVSITHINLPKQIVGWDSLCPPPSRLLCAYALPCVCRCGTMQAPTPPLLISIMVYALPTHTAFLATVAHFLALCVHYSPALLLGKFVPACS